MIKIIFNNMIYVPGYIIGLYVGDKITGKEFSDTIYYNITAISIFFLILVCYDMYQEYRKNKKIADDVEHERKYSIEPLFDLPISDLKSLRDDFTENYDEMYKTLQKGACKYSYKNVHFILMTGIDLYNLTRRMDNFISPVIDDSYFKIKHKAIDK